MPPLPNPITLNNSPISAGDTSRCTAFGTHYSDEEFDTVGGLILNRFGRVPKRGEQISFDNLAFKVLRADSRRLHLLQVTKKK